MEPRFQVWLEENGRYIIGEKEARILEGIRNYGSLIAAAKATGITYAHAWNLVEERSAKLGEPIVVARRGGEDGGGTALTEKGGELLERYLDLEARVGTYLGTRTERIFLEVRRSDLVIAGSSCIGVKLIPGLMKGLSVEVAEIGSTAGITAVMIGEADLAGLHIYDEESGKYNIPFIKRFWQAGSAILIKGYVREQGFMVKRGNPKGLTSLRDIVQKRCRIANRNAGSGTRSILKRLILQEGIDPSELKGYEHELRTHEEVAKEVYEGRADIGIGLRGAAEALGLGFIKICDEEFDFVCDKRRLNKKGVQTFINALRGKEFKTRLEQLPGLRCTPETGAIVEVTG
ncbi:MAG: substrate-binding domain-containing protein [Candidatus Methanosuratincola sp.]|nr:substrate-binding domain-containing protein [Candidatus Methanosuratincola sp.]